MSRDRPRARARALGLEPGEDERVDRRAAPISIFHGWNSRAGSQAEATIHRAAFGYGSVVSLGCGRGTPSRRDRGCRRTCARASLL